VISDFSGARWNITSSYAKKSTTPPSLFCISFLRKGQVLAYVGRIHNLKDLKDITLTTQLQPSALNPQPSNLKPQPSILNPHPHPSSLNPPPSTLTRKQRTATLSKGLCGVTVCIQHLNSHSSHYTHKLDLRIQVDKVTYDSG